MAKYNQSELQNLFLEFAKDLQEKISSWAKDYEFPTEPTIYTVFRDEHSFYKADFGKDYWPVIKNHYGDELWKMNSAIDCVKAHLDAGIMSVPKMNKGDGTPIVSPTFEQYGSHLIVDFIYPIAIAIKDSDKLPVSDEKLLSAYYIAKDLWSGKYDGCKAIVPLLNFSFSDDRADFADNIVLSRFTDDNKNNTFGWSWIPGASLYQRDFETSEFILSQQFDRKERNASIAIQKKIETLITAMRLHKPGRFGASLILTTSEIPEGFFRGQGMRSLNDIGPPPGNPLSMGENKDRYILRRNELDDISTIYNRLKQNRSKLDVAITRFNSSYSRLRNEDRLIDLVIALESSLLHGIGNKDQLKYRMSLRGATLLKESYNPRKTYNDIKTIYDERSSIVHMGKSISRIRSNGNLKNVVGDNDANRFLDYCENMIRYVLRKYLTRLSIDDSLKNINECLDNELLDSLQGIQAE